eukprot:TRINITY_DN3023_c0_g1_i1.p1 TRINITY_DN3023_c0_g1~~TRINITY_DN3023_c0_g1_i1.p1  ORF type:complete len:138 (-),score=47.07 TRINITY_DN3023_c0_g1_i1:157-570(-)
MEQVGNGNGSGGGGTNGGNGNGTMDVEGELRVIDTEFASGAMNAFGSAADEDDVLKEMRRVTQLQSQIFRRCLDQLRQNSDEAPFLDPHDVDGSISRAFTKTREPGSASVYSQLQRLGKHVNQINDQLAKLYPPPDR